MEERYQPSKELGYGGFGVAWLVKDKVTGELFAVKYIERGKKIDEKVQREIINHRSLRHPNIVQFKEVFLTPTHLAIVMEYALGGELFDRMCTEGRFSEDELPDLGLQKLVDFCNHSEIVGRCCFLKASVLHSKPKSAVGTPAYIAHEVLLNKEYDGRFY